MANVSGEALRNQEEESFLYFAYGSNLLTERIHLRNPSAAFCCVACLQVSAPCPAAATSCAASADEGVRISRSLFLRTARRQHWARNAALSDQSTSGPLQDPGRPTGPWFYAGHLLSGAVPPAPVPPRLP
ncbi:hypothetical protein CB1_000813004 [Camelus ferus]|nr:hypothetical protein CB1_000813004 [Camelus ferus]